MAEVGHLRLLSKTLRNLTRRRASTLGQITLSNGSAVGDLTYPVGTSGTGSDVRPFEDMPGPTGPYRWPVVGTLLNFKPFSEFSAENTHELLRSMSRTYGPVFRIQLGQNTVVVSEPSDIETVYRSEGTYPARPNLGLREIYAERTGIKSRDVATLQGKEWHEARTPLNKLLVRVNSARSYLQDQSLVADDFVKVLANSDGRTGDELSELFFRFASESIGVVCFNSRLGLLDEHSRDNTETTEFLAAVKDTFAMLHKSLTGESVAHVLYRNETYRTFEEASKVIHTYSKKQIQKAREKLHQQMKGGHINKDDPNLLLSLILDDSLDDDQVSQILESLYSGGTDSTAGSLQALFYNLALHPEKQERLHSEIVSVIGGDGKVTPENLNCLPYLKACVKESFRVLYPVSAVMRVLPTDVVLSGYQVPAGTQIFLANLLTCERHFARPTEYVPERWLRSPEERRLGRDIPKNAVLPFSVGPRNCVGRRFAEQEIYLATIKVIQKLKLGVSDESRDTPFVYRIFLQPAAPIKFTFKKRESE